MNKGKSNRVDYQIGYLDAALGYGKAEESDMYLRGYEAGMWAVMAERKGEIGPLTYQLR